MTGAPPDLLRTPLHAAHRRLGARLIPFAGYEMPVSYRSILEEHRTVRTAAGLFDLSHMGEVFLEGPGAVELARYAVVTDPATLERGQAQYSMLCQPDGGIIDDLIIYRLTDAERDVYMVVCNASNRPVVVEHLRRVATEGRFNATVDDRSDRTALIAPQGPASAELLAELTYSDLTGLKYYRSVEGSVAGVKCLIARTGYTGEDGFELFCDAADAEPLWNQLLAAGVPFGLAPCGLGTRDTLRLEAGMPLYGNELDRSTNPFEANLGRLVKLEKGEFIGREALQAVSEAGPTRRLVGLVMRDTAGAVPRRGYPVERDGRRIGEVTSGTASATLGERIAMAYLAADEATVGTEVDVVVRERPHRAEQVKLPFYKRPSSRQA